MSERDYDKEPIILRATIEIFVYEPLTNIDQRLKSFTERSDCQEGALNFVGGFFSDSCGLNELSIEVKG